MKCVCILAASLSIFAQEAAPPPPPPTAVSTESCYLDGHVIDQSTGSPIAKAAVTLAVKINRVDYSARVISGSDGRFQFAGLPPGKYRLSAHHRSYAGAAYGASRPGQPGDLIALAAGEAKRDVSLAMVPLGSISGRVLDEDGDPLANAQVQIFLETFVRGKRHMQTINSVTTDDRGEYSITMQPGRYYAEATDRAYFRRVAGSDVSAGRPGQPAQEFGYGYLFYPNTLKPLEAVAIVVTDHAVRGIDIRLPRVARVSVRGRVSGLPETSKQGVVPLISFQPEDIPGSFGMGMTTSVSLQMDHTFLMPVLAAGPYLMQASATGADGKQYHAMQRVVIGSGENDFTIQVFPNVEVKGSVQIVGDGAEKQRPTQVRLIQDEIYSPISPPQAELKEDLSFTLPNVTPGLWDIAVQPLPAGSYVKSMMLGDQDVLMDGMTITNDTPRPVKIVVSTRGATISGKVEGGGAKLPRILVIPEGNESRIFRFTKMTVSDEDGNFKFIGMRPGRYRLFAFDAMEFDATQNPERWKPYEARGEAVEVAEGATVTKTLLIIITEPEKHR